MRFDIAMPAHLSDLFMAPQPAHLRGPQPIATIIIDTEEDFDWQTPIEGTPHDTAYLHHLDQLIPILRAYGAVPTLLLTFPILENPNIVAQLRRMAERGDCALGLQLHAWVTPPFAGQSRSDMSFASNLDSDIEAQKLENLYRKFLACFAFPPLVFRSGRYGLGRHTARLISALGITIDTSVAPCTSMADEGGPDYSRINFEPFWFGDDQKLLELPLCRSIIGWGGAYGRLAYRRVMQPGRQRQMIGAALARLGCAERVTLSPEGNGARAVRRLTNALIAHQQRVLPLSFHSSSIWPGRNPYVRNRRDLHRFFDDLSAMLTDLADRHGCRFVRTDEIPNLLAPPLPVSHAAP
jgi:hypothetical protein